jgi:hypothetical protein
MLFHVSHDPLFEILGEERERDEEEQEEECAMHGSCMSIIF